MTRSFLTAFLLFSLTAFGQKDTSKWVRAFPITDYMVDLNDSVKVVQIKLPAGMAMPEKQLGLLKGIFRDQHSDTATIGFGRCNLIKGDYYYFSINYKVSGQVPRAGDLLFTMVDKSPVYFENIVRLASQFIGLKNVYETPLYNQYAVFADWSKQDEETLLDSIVADIHFTGKYFLDNNPSMNAKIEGGRFDGKMALNTMIVCTKEDVKDFLQYIIARPRLYAGHDWKISEIFATWLTHGAPSVISH